MQGSKEQFQMKRLVAMAVFSFAVPMFGDILDTTCYNGSVIVTGSPSCTATASGDGGSVSASANGGLDPTANAFSDAIFNSTIYAEAIVTETLFISSPTVITFDYSATVNGDGSVEGPGVGPDGPFQCLGPGYNCYGDYTETVDSSFTFNFSSYAGDDGSEIGRAHV